MQRIETEMRKVTDQLRVFKFHALFGDIAAAMWRQLKRTADYNAHKDLDEALDEEIYNVDPDQYGNEQERRAAIEEQPLHAAFVTAAKEFQIDFWFLRHFRCICNNASHCGVLYLSMPEREKLVLDAQAVLDVALSEQYVTKKDEFQQWLTIFKSNRYNL